MPKTLLLLLTLLLAPTTLLAQSPALSAEAGLNLSGTPLSLTVNLEGSTRGAYADIFVDGRNAGQQALEPGSNELHLGGIHLTTGHHDVEVRIGTAAAQVTVRVIPGWLSILPPLLAIALALLTRDVIVSLFLGVFGGAMIVTAWHPAAALGRTVDRFIVPALADSDHVSIIVFTCLLGGMVGLITKSGGTHGIVERLQPLATNSRRGQVATWMMGVLIFFDDYANTLIVGPTMRPITDKLRISREKLAYLVDSTAAPVVCLFPISTWVGFEIGLIDDAFRQLGLPLDGYSTFLASIPYRFYPIFALILVLTLALSKRDFGPMLRAERRARTTGALLPPGAVPIADYSTDAIEPSPQTPRRALNAFLPIITVVGITLLGLYITGSAGQVRGPDTGTVEWLRQVLTQANSFNALLWASLSGVLVALLLPLLQRALRLSEGIEAMVAGFKAMLMALIVLTLAWALSAVCGELRTAEYLVSLVHGLVAPMWLPAITFVLAAVIAFATGTSWGTMGILEPLVIPICHNLSVAAGLGPDTPQYGIYMLGSIASVLAGSVWGDHCSPISDTTILSSMATGCDHIAHVRTQIPYALAVGFLGILIGNVLTAYGLQPWVALVLGAGLIVTIVLWQGEKLEQDDDEAPPEPAPEAAGG